MHMSPQLHAIAGAFRELQSQAPDDDDLTATLLWLLSSSEEGQRTLTDARPTARDLEELCHRLGPRARAWVQFSPEACILLQK